jgi:hypothetical protein
VDGVEGEQQRDLEPRLLDGDALELPDPHRIGHAQDRAQPVADLVLGDHEVGQQLDLLQLLLQGHLGEQGIDPPLDVAVGPRPRRLERLLVAGLGPGHDAPRGRQDQRQHRQDDRSPEPPHGISSSSGTVGTNRTSRRK